MINRSKEGNVTTFYLDGEAVLMIRTPEGAQDDFREEGGLIVWHRRTDVPVTSMVMEARACFEAKHTLVPAVSYDGNPWGRDHEYKGYEKDGRPYTYAWHRTAVPGASASWNDRMGAAVFGRGSCSACLFLREKKAVCRVIWPETEEPEVLYSDGWGPAFHGSMEPSDSFIAYLCIDKGKEAVRQMLHHAWRQNYVKKNPQRKAEEIWRLSVDYARRLDTQEPDGFCAFSIGFTWDGKEWVKRPELKYEIGWCGQNASLAVSLMYDYRKNGNKGSLETAVAVLDSWISMARNESGLLLSRYDPEDSLIDACNMGTAGLQLMEAFEEAQRLGMEKPEWLEAAFGICDFIRERQLPDGKVGMSWNRDGSLHESEGSAGAFLVLPLAGACRKFGKREYLEAAVRAFDYYFEDFLEHSYGTSGALDTCCIDKESVLPLLKAGLLLYEVTKEASYLDRAEEAAWYLSTWQWHHSVAYPEDTTLGSLHYDTFGGTAVSTSHHHLDPFALCYVPDLLKLAELTGHREWQERALAIWNNGVQVISDGTLQVAPTGVRPAGSCDEGYIHTRWGNRPAEDSSQSKGKKTGWGESFGVTQWLVAWPCAFRLEVLRRCQDWELLNGRKGETMKERIFYVDDVNGEDTRTGLSPLEAWKTLDAVNSHMFRPGDVIRLKKGGRWHGMLHPKGSGSQEAPIRLEGYGEGARPEIHGDGSYAAIYLEGVSFWQVRGIAVTNHAEERGIRQGICICGAPLGITGGILIEECEVSDVTGENRRSRDVYASMYWNSGIYVTMPGRASEKNHLHDIIISHNHVHDVLTSGIRVNQQEDFINDIHHTHVVIRGNRIERTGSDGIIVANCISPLIDGNRCVDAGALGSLEDTRLIAGVWVCATENALIQRNEVAGTRLFENDGTAFDTDWGTAGTTIFQYNYTHGNQGGFWLDCTGLNRNRECRGTILRYNISVDDSRCLIQDDQGIRAELYGNLFLHTGKEGPAVCMHRAGESHMFTRNVFAFDAPPSGGWQASGFSGNWYGTLEDRPETDPEAMDGTPFSLEGLRERLEQSPQERYALGDMLAKAAAGAAE